MRGDQHLCGRQSVEARHWCPAHQPCHLVVVADDAFVIDAYAKFGPYPGAPVVVLHKRVDVAATVADVDRFKRLPLCVEAYHALVFHSHPHVAFAVGHQAACKRVCPVLHAAHSPMALHLPRSTYVLQHAQLVLAAHPYPVVLVAGDAIYAHGLPVVQGEWLEEGLAAGDEVHAGAVVVNPHVVVGILQDAAGVLRRCLHLSAVVGQHSAHVVHRPQVAVGHLHDVIHVGSLARRRRDVVGQLKRFRVGPVEHQPLVGAHPYLPPAVFHDAPHVAAGQILSTLYLQPFTPLIVPHHDALLLVDDAHAIFVVANV